MTNSNRAPQRTIEQVVSDEITKPATKYNSSPRITQALHTGVITPRQAALLQRYFSACDHTKHKERNALMTDELFSAMRSLDNMPSEKTPEQLKAEFYIRKYKREQNWLEFDLSLLLPENDIQDNAKLIRNTKTTLACSLICNALQRRMHEPSQLSLALLNHPCFSLLFHGEQRQKLLASQAPLNLQTFDSHDQLLQLSHQLRAALPELAAGFENEPDLGKVWQEAVLVLLCSPLPLPLYKNLASTDFAAQVLTSYQTSDAIQISHLPVIGKILLYPCRWLAGIYSWCVLRGVINKSKRIERRKGYQF